MERNLQVQRPDSEVVVNLEVFVTKQPLSGQNKAAMKFSIRVWLAYRVATAQRWLNDPIFKMMNFDFFDAPWDAI